MNGAISLCIHLPVQVFVRRAQTLVQRLLGVVTQVTAGAPLTYDRRKEVYPHRELLLVRAEQAVS
jgi:hypothetical protein